MNEDEKQKYLEKYYQEKQHGVKFFPDIIYKDLLVSFAIFVFLVGLAIFMGVPSDPPADPSDTSYIPRPEWYFLFLFQLLKYFPGKLEWIGTTIIPGIAILALLLLPFYDRSPFRYWSKRKVAISIMSVIVVGMVVLTIIAVATTPLQPESGTLATTLSDQILVGQGLFSENCVECHGTEGEGGEIKGVEGLEGVVVKSIRSQDMMYTRTDDTLFNVIDYGQPDLGMTPFGKAYGGQLTRGDIEAIVTFMRYSWDDRAELPAEVVAASAMPTLGPNEVPSFDVHIQPILKRYCISCHRPGKKNNSYLMGTYEEVMTSGDHAPNLVAGNLESNMILMLKRQEIEAGGPMPPTKELKPDLIQIFERWVMGGLLQTTEQAKAASPQATPPPAVPGVTPTETPKP